jgi:hypothetical protein
LVRPGIELRQFRLNTCARVINCVVGHDRFYCTLFVDLEATASCRNARHLLSSCKEALQESFDELSSLSSCRFPAIEAALRFRFLVQRCGCTSVALRYLRDTLSRAADTVSAHSLCTMWLLRQLGATANLAGEGRGRVCVAGKPVEAASLAMRAVPV